VPPIWMSPLIIGIGLYLSPVPANY